MKRYRFLAADAAGARLLAAGAVRAMLLAGGVVGAVWPVAAVAQHSMPMPGMTMPDAAPEKTVERVESRPVARPPQSGGAVDHSTMDHSAMGHPAPAAPSAMPDAMPGMDHAQMDHGAMGHAMIVDPAYRAASDAAVARMPAGSAMAGMAMGTSAGFYSQGSGTSRLPAAEGPMRGYMVQAGEWMLMAHGYAWGVATDQGGPRGKSEAFVQSMAMLMADRDLGDRWHIQLRAMNSLEPLMGARGYTNLFATGELANDRPLVDRQHPHDLFMELAAKVDYRLGNGNTLFLYGGPVGEPALGPSAFMHRGSARYQPMSPITHHWFELDAYHVRRGDGGLCDARVPAGSFGVQGT
ncbi:hypothetical protein [Sphingomonas faeni]|uniref:hypothetical protein n=1 Tax=Sphingomonas faeni TaxID=185950 RepID=UPI00277ECC82|nr:hypothetical protein [Sphingomonas faeni]MDQ0838155.1 hypothetical protein [Sphingomonas faeni]